MAGRKIGEASGAIDISVEVRRKDRRNRRRPTGHPDADRGLTGAGDGNRKTGTVRRRALLDHRDIVYERGRRSRS